MASAPPTYQHTNTPTHQHTNITDEKDLFALHAFLGLCGDKLRTKRTVAL